jgi:hypothetical protein
VHKTKRLKAGHPACFGLLVLLPEHDLYRFWNGLRCCKASERLGHLVARERAAGLVRLVALLLRRRHCAALAKTQLVVDERAREARGRVYCVLHGLYLRANLRAREMYRRAGRTEERVGAARVRTDGVEPVPCEDVVLVVDLQHSGLHVAARECCRAVVIVLPRLDGVILVEHDECHRMRPGVLSRCCAALPAVLFPLGALLLELGDASLLVQMRWFRPRCDDRFETRCWWLVTVEPVLAYFRSFQVLHFLQYLDRLLWRGCRWFVGGHLGQRNRRLGPRPHAEGLEGKPVV